MFVNLWGEITLITYRDEGKFMERHFKYKYPRYVVNSETQCWEWQLSLITNGYGQISIGGKSQLAHRYYYEQKHGKIPKEMQLDHLCRKRSCVNPDHLEVVTCVENIRRGKIPKITKQQAEAIKVDTRTYKEITAEYGICASTICQIKKHNIWK